MTPEDQLEQALARLHQLHEKYETLVWYARKGPPDHPMWRDTPPEIINGARNAMARAEEQYPDEIDRLSCPERGDWEHGFNSGVLAAVRLITAYLHDPGETPAEGIDPEMHMTRDEQIELAEEEFPELYT